MCGQSLKAQFLLLQLRASHEFCAVIGLTRALSHLPLAPRRRVLGLSRPDAAPGGAGVALGGGISPLAVARIVARVAGTHHRLAEIASLGLAGRGTSRAY